MQLGRVTIRSYMKEHLSLYVFIAVLFVTGVIFGAVMVGALTLDQRQEIDRHLASFFHTVDQGFTAEHTQSFRKLFGMNVRWVLLIWLLGLSVIGLPLIFVLDFLKGVLVGFTVGFMSAQYAWKGLLFALVSVAPQNLVIVPAIIISSAAAAGFSLFLVRSRFLRQGGSVYQPFMRYTIVTITMIAALAGVSLAEALFSPRLMKWAIPILTALS